MKSLITIFSLFFFLVYSVSAEILNPTHSSPYSVYLQADEVKQDKITQAFQDLAKESRWSKNQAEALMSLATKTPSISGDEVLEALDQAFINWFYGLTPTPKAQVHKVARLSKTPDEATCTQVSLCVVVDIQTQRVFANLNGRPVEGVNNQPVSTAREGYITPRGLYSVEELAGPDRKSSRYNGAFMGYAMQIWGNYFLHATSKDNYPKLGGPASAGCIRMKLAAAKTLNLLMKEIGTDNIRVVVK